MLDVARHPSPPGIREAPVETAFLGRQVVGMDLHRHRSVLARMTGDGRRLGMARYHREPAGVTRAVGRMGKCPKVVLEATYGWYWAAELLTGRRKKLRGAN
jgi:hypothetical protein